MPLYEYQCAECGHLTEVLQRLSDPPLAECPECGGAVKKLLSAPAFQFKGTGWYVTDYARKGKGKGKGEGDAKGGSSAKADKGTGGGEKSSTGEGSAAKSDTKSKPKASSSSD